MSRCKVCNIDRLNPHLAGAKTTSEELTHAAQAADAVVAQTSAVDLVDRLPVRLTRKADIARTRVARNGPRLGLAKLGVKSDTYVANVHLERPWSCDTWRETATTIIYTLDAGTVHISDVRHLMPPDTRGPFDVGFVGSKNISSASFLRGPMQAVRLNNNIKNDKRAYAGGYVVREPSRV
jgi:hypothetical protein